MQLVVVMAVRKAVSAVDLVRLSTFATPAAKGV